MTEKDVRDKLLTNCIALSDHMLRRIGEQKMYNINEIIYRLAKDGELEEGFNTQGVNWSIDGVSRGLKYRLIVGPHPHSQDFLYIVTLFKVIPGIEKGKNYQKFSHRDLVYTMTHTR